MVKKGAFRNLSYISIGRLTGIVLQAIFYLAFAAILGPEDYGELNYIIAIAGTVSLFSRFGLNFTVNVFRAKEKEKISDQINTLSIISTSTAAFILLFFNVHAALLALALSFFVMNQGNLLGLKRYKNYMYNIILKNGMVLSIPFLFYFIFDIQGVIIGMAIANFLASVPFLKKIKFKSFFDIKHHYRVIIHNFGVDSSINLSRTIDKILVAPLYGFFVVGVYQFNMQILFALEVLPAILYAFLLSEESSGFTHKKIIYLGVFLSIIFAILAIFLSPFFVNEFFPKYSEGIFSLQILVISIIPLTISSIFNAKLQARESTLIGFTAIVRIGTLLISIAILGKVFGLVGLSLAVLVSAISYVLFLYILYRRQKDKFPNGTLKN